MPVHTKKFVPKGIAKTLGTLCKKFEGTKKSSSSRGPKRKSRDPAIRLGTTVLGDFTFHAGDAIVVKELHGGKGTRKVWVSVMTTPTYLVVTDYRDKWGGETGNSWVISDINNVVSKPSTSRDPKGKSVIMTREQKARYYGDQVGRQQPPGRRMAPGSHERVEWQRGQLHSVLNREGLSDLYFAAEDAFMDRVLKQAHKMHSENYRQAYGSTSTRKPSSRRLSGESNAEYAGRLRSLNRFTEDEIYEKAYRRR